eukprot:COSAG01_NODE_25436_length_745_cov_1.071207_1_plen_83_part_00
MDSINAWPTILTPDATSRIGRQEVPLDLSENGLGCFFPNGSITGASCALIVGDYKLVTGAQGIIVTGALRRVEWAALHHAAF